ncbi:hypothetical protein MKEN_01116900 [Mycena kentingensis (nom. inval.)]|nr:hypothetical protein MKEN_01116900 [Mycena kentingensis (nom. inval.)]
MYSSLLPLCIAPPTLVTLLLLQLALVDPALAGSRTIDDTNGDSSSGAKPSYSPADQFSPNSNCPDCVYHPDAGSTFDGTWHDTSQIGDERRSVSFSFTGTSVALFCTLVNRQSSSTTLGPTHLTLTVDGASQGNFDYTPDGSSDFLYQHQVFNVPNLANTQHSVTLSTNNAGGSMLLFDYARYTFPDVQEQPTTQPAGGTDQTNTKTTTVVKTETGTETETVAGQQGQQQTTAGSGGDASSATNKSGSSSTTAVSPSGSNSASIATGSATPSALPASASSNASPSSVTNGGVAAPTNTANNTGVIAAAGIAGAFGVIAVLLAVLLCRRRRRRLRAVAAERKATPTDVALVLPTNHADTSAQAALPMTGSDGAAIVPELHYGRAGVGDPEKAMMRRSFFDLRDGVAAGGRRGLRRQSSAGTLGSLTAASASGSSAPVSTLNSPSQSRAALLDPRLDRDREALADDDSASRPHHRARALSSSALSGSSSDYWMSTLPTSPPPQYGDHVDSSMVYSSRPLHLPSSASGTL